MVVKTVGAGDISPHRRPSRICCLLLRKRHRPVDETTGRIGAAEAEQTTWPERPWSHTRQKVSEAVSLNGQPATLSRNRCRSEWVKPEST